MDFDGLPELGILHDGDKNRDSKRRRTSAITGNARGMPPAATTSGPSQSGDRAGMAAGAAMGHPHLGGFPLVKQEAESQPLDVMGMGGALPPATAIAPPGAPLPTGAGKGLVLTAPQTGLGKGQGKGKGSMFNAAGAQYVKDEPGPYGLGPVAVAQQPAAAPAAPGPTDNGMMRIKREDVRLPLDINSRVACKWRDGQYHMCRIIERRQRPGSSDPADWEYYVHYLKFNRRMDEWVQLSQFDLDTVEVEIPDPDPKKKKKAVHDDSDSEHGDFDPNALREHEEFTKVKNIEMIELGRHQMETWYFSPFPPEYKDCKILYFCEFTLAFFKRRSQLLRHMSKLSVRHPPGEEIYRNGNVCMFEVDGRKAKSFCQNLCYMAKLFLDHKTLFYDVDLFLFYVLCEIDERGAHMVGYFSKEKCSEEGYNLACILTLPAYQRKGYGKFLISMSYELSKIEGKVGTPERPLSDLGRVSYHGYWTRELLTLLREHDGTISIKDLSDLTAIKTEDIVHTLQQLQMVQYQKGQHVICAAPKLIEKHLKAAGGPGLVVDPARIVWTPYNAEREYATYRN